MSLPTVTRPGSTAPDLERAGLPDDPPPAGYRRRRPRPRVALGAAAAVALAAAGVGALALGGGTGSGTAAAVALTTYADPADGFAIGHPAGWAPTSIPHGVLLQGPGQNAISVKKVTLAQSVDAGNIAALRAVTDAVLAKPEAKLTILSSGATTLGGLPGVFYVYHFPTPVGRGVTGSGGSGQGAHTHYFVFAGRDMYTLVFQSLPASGFEALAPTFDAVAASFRTLVG
jgi:hypothetical protein